MEPPDFGLLPSGAVTSSFQTPSPHTMTTAPHYLTPPAEVGFGPPGLAGPPPLLQPDVLSGFHPAFPSSMDSKTNPMSFQRYRSNLDLGNRGSPIMNMIGSHGDAQFKNRESPIMSMMGINSNVDQSIRVSPDMNIIGRHGNVESRRHESPIMDVISRHSNLEPRERGSPVINISGHHSNIELGNRVSQNMQAIGSHGNAEIRHRVSPIINTIDHHIDLFNRGSPIMSGSGHHGNVEPSNRVSPVLSVSDHHGNSGSGLSLGDRADFEQIQLPLPETTLEQVSNTGNHGNITQGSGGHTSPLIGTDSEMDTSIGTKEGRQLEAIIAQVKSFDKSADDGSHSNEMEENVGRPQSGFTDIIADVEASDTEQKKRDQSSPCTDNNNHDNAVPGPSNEKMGNSIGNQGDSFHLNEDDLDDVDDLLSDEDDEDEDADREDHEDDDDEDLDHSDMEVGEIPRAAKYDSEDDLDTNTDDDDLSDDENAKIEEAMKQRVETKKRKKERDVFKDFVVREDDEEDEEEEEEDSDEGGEIGEILDTREDVEPEPQEKSEEIPKDGETEEIPKDDEEIPEGMDEAALDHLTRLRARMSSQGGNRDDLNRYFEALISYDDGVPSDKPFNNSDEEWVEPEPEPKKRSKVKKNRKGSPKKAHKCHICARIFYQAKQLDKHLAMHRRKQQKALGESKLPPGVRLPPQKSLACETCGKQFRRTAHLTRHRMIHTGEKPHVCDVCGDRFSRPDKLRVHKKLHDKNRQFICKVCGETFTLAKLLRLHRKTHKTETSKLYTCDVCNKNFTVYARLHRHRMIHTGRKPYLCEICGDRFTQSTDLQRHRIIHTGVKAHLCDLCGKKFYHSAHLRRHAKIHDRQKNYICGVCGGQFARSDILKRHEKIHTGEKEYACDQCGKLFTRSSHLQRHMITHNGRPQMQMCKFCSKPFSSNEKLRQHVKMHHPMENSIPGNQHQQQQQEASSSGMNRACSVTPDVSHPCTPVPVQSPCQRSTMMQTPDQSRMQSPSARSQCSEPERMQYRPEQQFHFNHHLGLQPHQGFFPNGPRFDCMVCGEQFPNANMLEIHYSVHTLDKHAYIPNMAEKHMEGQYMTPRPFDLHRHNEIYRCENCGDRFNDIGHFQIHCLMHTSDFSDSYQRQLQFSAPPFANPGFPVDKRPQKMDNFRPLLGPIPQPQNLSLSQINPSCERSKPPCRQDAQNSPQDFHFSLNQHPPQQHQQQQQQQQQQQIHQQQQPQQQQPQFPEPYRNQHNNLESPLAMVNAGHNKPLQDLAQRQNSREEPNVHSKPVSIMNNLKPKKRPRLIEAVPDSDQLQEAVGFTVDGRPVLNPDVNAGRTKMGDLRKFKCGTCGETFDTPQDRIEHVKIHIADMESQNMCEFCDSKFTNGQDLKAHVRAEHKSKAESELPPIPPHPMDALERISLSPTPSVTSSEVPVTMVPTTSSSGLAVNFECVECEAVFGTESGLRRHSRTHNPERQPAQPKEYNCDVCFKTFLRPHHLTRHKLIHSGEKPYACEHCSMAFGRSDKLSSHLSKVHGLNYSPPKKEVKCEKCDIIFGTKADLRDHMRSEHAESYDCETCFKSFKRMDHLRRHRRTHSKSPSKSKNLLNICEYCNHEFKSEYELNQHVRKIHNDQQTFQCGICQGKFVNNDDLTLHISLSHDVDPGDVEIPDPGNPGNPIENIVVEKPPKPRVKKQPVEVECETCQAKFSSHTALKKHRINDHKELVNEKCTCDLCGKEFMQLKQLRRHMKTHSNEKPYMCDECGDSFSRSSHLIRHKIRHTGEKEFKCDQCPAQFSRSDHLLCHKRTHSGNKPYVCDICGLQFASGQGLKGHMTTHTGEKPYLCRHCGEAFSRNSHLVRHRAQAHNDGVQHECELCGKSFCRRDQLKRHEKTHSGEKPHVCQTCGKAFTRAPLLVKHEKTHEKQSEPMTHSRIPISMMDWPKWADYHPPPMATGHPQFPFSGSILQAAMSASHIS